MKRNRKKEIEALKKQLEPLDRLITAPEELAGESIAAMVDGQKQAKKKLSRKAVVRRSLGAVAAVLAVAVGVNTAVYFYNPLAGNKVPEMIASAEQPVSGNSQQVFVDYFTALKAKAITDHKKSAIEFYNGFGMKGAVTVDTADINDAVPEAAVGSDTARNDSSTSAAEESHGKTNVQVEGIDEQDIIKNDGRYLYILTKDTLKIVDTKGENGMELVSKTKLCEGYYSRIKSYDTDETTTFSMASGMFLSGSYCAVVFNTYTEAVEAYKGKGAYNRSTSKSEVRVYDVSDKTAPKQVKEFSQDGSVVSTRLVDNRLLLVSSHRIWIDALKSEEDLIVYNDVVPHTAEDNNDACLPPENITIMPQDKDNYSDSYLLVSSIDLNSLDSKQVKTSAVLGAGENVYCTNDNLYVAQTTYEYQNARVGTAFFSQLATTKIYRFTIGNGIVAMDKAGEIEGYLLNQFSLDEKDGYLRVATTSTAKDGKATNLITVLDSSMKKAGEIRDIAPNETIRSVRYIGRYGYVVTFENTDPLFVIDFADPTKPKIVAELKMPGFSSYLHPFEGYLVGVGRTGTETGATNGVKISLFDISNPTAPKEIDKIEIRDAWFGGDHKQVMDCSEQGILGIAYSAERFDYNNRYVVGNMGRFCTLKIENGRFKLLGDFENYSDTEYNRKVEEYNARAEKLQNQGVYRGDYYYGNEILRGTYIGTTLYTVSEGRVCSFPIAGGERIQTLDYDF